MIWAAFCPELQIYTMRQNNVCLSVEYNYKQFIDSDIAFY